MPKGTDKDTDDGALVALWPAQALWLVEQAEALGVLLLIARDEARLDQLAGSRRRSLRPRGAWPKRRRAGPRAVLTPR